MHTAVVGIGSNVDGASGMIERALSQLSLRGCRVSSVSGMYCVDVPYVNLVARMDTSLGHDELKALAKDIESGMGRTAEMKSEGVVPVDIDVVVFDGEVVRPRDYSCEYFSRGLAQLR